MTKHQNDDCFTIETILRNLPEQDPFVVRWNFPLMEPATNLDPDDLKQPNAGRKKEFHPLEILAAIRHTSDSAPISIPAWANLSGASRSTIRDSYAPKLRAKGYIKTIGDGQNARHTITPSGLLAIQK